MHMSGVCVPPDVSQAIPCHICMETLREFQAIRTHRHVLLEDLCKQGVGVVFAK